MNRILLLEDDVSLIDGLVYSLKKNEFDVEVARTVYEAKQYLSELDRYDLLILDVTLPDGTGFDVCERVRKENQQIPIIFLTASDEEVSVTRGLDSGGDDILPNLSSWGNCIPVSGRCYAGPEFPKAKKTLLWNAAIFPLTCWEAEQH